MDIVFFNTDIVQLTAWRHSYYVALKPIHKVNSRHGEIPWFLYKTEKSTKSQFALLFVFLLEKTAQKIQWFALVCCAFEVFYCFQNLEISCWYKLAAKARSLLLIENYRSTKSSFEIVYKNQNIKNAASWNWKHNKILFPWLFYNHYLHMVWMKGQGESDEKWHSMCCVAINLNTNKINQSNILSILIRRIFSLDTCLYPRLFSLSI